MKVAFLYGTGMSSAINFMAAIGIILAQDYNCEVILSSNYIGNHMLPDCFSGKMKEKGKNQEPYRFLYGSTEYCRELWSMKHSRKDNILEIPVDGVTIVLPPDVGEKKMFYYNDSRSTCYLMDIIGENRIVFQSVIEEAELFVVFLPQDVDKIQKFFYRFSSLIPKAIFVIEEVQHDKRLFYRQILLKYGINNENITIIPKCNEFKDACEDGKLDVFLQQNKATKSLQYNFVFSIKYIAKLIDEHKLQTEKGE